MQFRVLGPLELRLEDGTHVTPTAPKLRQVLALLATRPNTMVRADQLLEELWEDRPPSSAMTTLQTYIYQLRKLFDGRRLAGPADRGADDGVHIVTRPGGYVLSVPVERLDVTRFQTLARDGRTAIEAGDLVGGSRYLEQALALWRGPALVDLTPGPVLGADVLRLEEARKGLVEQRIEVELALGRYHDVIGELVELTAKDPTHEGFCAKLMLALNGAGRRSEALQTYQRGRTVLADELGLEPSTQLQKLHTQLLRSDSGLGPDAVRPLSWSTALPVADLPATCPSLIGRTEQLERVVDLLIRPSPEPSPTLITVVGPPGGGKTAFCAHVAGRVAEAFPDGQFYVRIGSFRDDPGACFDAIGTLLAALGVARAELPGNLEARAALWRARASGRRRLLVISDDVCSMRQIGPLLAFGPGSATLIAGRRRLAGAAIASGFELPRLTVDQSVQLVAEVVGPRVQDESSAATRLAALCGGLPLALRVAANRLVLRPHWSVQRLVAHLEVNGLMGGLSDGDLNLRASYQATFGMLSGSGQRAFTVLATRTQPTTTVREAADLLGVDVGTAEDLLEQLVQCCLAEAEPSPLTGGDEFRYRVDAVTRQGGFLLGSRGVRPDVGHPGAVRRDPLARHSA